MKAVGMVPDSGERPATKHYRTGQPPQRATATWSSLTGWDYAGAFKYRVAGSEFFRPQPKKARGRKRPTGQGLPSRFYGFVGCPLGCAFAPPPIPKFGF